MEPMRKKPGAALRRLRKAGGLTLREVSRRTGVSVSTLSKVENDKLSLSFHKLAQISEGLEIDIARLFEAPADEARTDTCAGGRRSICRAGCAAATETPDFRQLRPAADLLHKRLTPLITEVRARAIDAVTGLRRLAGEVYAFVIEGEADLHTDIYVPLRLTAGDSIYFDGATGHAWINAGPGRCRVLTVSSGAEPEER